MTKGHFDGKATLFNDTFFYLAWGEKSLVKPSKVLTVEIGDILIGKINKHFQHYFHIFFSFLQILILCFLPLFLFFFLFHFFFCLFSLPHFHLHFFFFHLHFPLSHLEHLFTFFFYTTNAPHFFPNIYAYFFLSTHLLF